jgi:hypothetical protein
MSSVHLSRFWIGAALVLLVGLGHSMAMAQTSVQPVNPSKPPVARVKDAPPPVKKAKKVSAAPVQHAPSGEAMPEREKRLLRECKGRPNAGACLGYAS